MSAAFITRRVSYSIAWRLAAGLLPSIVAVALVVGLFYYGEIGRGAPRLILVFAALLTILSLGITVANARYFMNRIGRLARVTRGKGDGGTQDEFDRIEQVVGTLGTRLSAAEAERNRVNAAAAANRHDEATMLAGVVADTLARLDEVRFPLHILLEAPFGELNENQEELLRDARGAADAMDVALRRLAQVADADRGALSVQAELVQINDVVRSVMPLARAAAERRGARVDMSLEPGLHRVMADRARLAEALALLATEAAESAEQQVPLSVVTTRRGSGAVISLSPIPPSARRLAHATDESAAETSVPDRNRVTSIFAERLITAQGGRLALENGALEICVG
jgi:signal transduction histidine kinase